MTIAFIRGDIFDDDAEAIVNAVNCVGVMGAGLALKFKERYPDYFADYYWKCRHGEILWGHIDTYEIAAPIENPRWIVSFPTKRHWKDESRIGTITFGLGQLGGWMRKERLTSAAIPALGCGLGGLAWDDVKRQFLLLNSYLPMLDLRVYEPH
jgi:O-acetyl-ADP-ribose deacetylase (regulator of RNase III)